MVIERQILNNQPTIFTEDYLRCQEEVDILMQSGFFHFKNGVAICHRDGNGVLRKIEITQTNFIK